MAHSASCIPWFMEDKTTKKYMISMVFLLALLACFAAAAEETVEHNDSHQVLEVRQSDFQVVRNGDSDTHILIYHYDLFCVDCGRVIQKDARQESFQENHYWTVGRKDPTCDAEGEDIRICSLCGAQVITSIPALGHDWSEWKEEEIPLSLQCVTDRSEKRTCQRCGKEETQILAPAPGHQWVALENIPATCTEPGRSVRQCSVCGETETDDAAEQPPLGHQFSDIALLVKRPAGEVTVGGVVIGTVSTPSTCVSEGTGSLLCVRCQAASQSVSIPAGGHFFGPWVENELEGKDICLQDKTSTRVCQDCGETETRVDAPAPGHQWVTISFTMPTCLEDGTLLRQCSVCKEEETIVSPAPGHAYTWVQISAPSPSADGISEYVCAVCGNVADTRRVPFTQMMYNNVITSFGPATRDLIGGSVWNRVTPIDLSEDGVYTYPLIASNRYTVGTATVVIAEGVETVTYRLNSTQIQVHSESLVIYPNLEALRTGENAEAFTFGEPIDIQKYFGEDTLVIIAITLQADYNAVGFGVQYFAADQAQIESMLELLD